MKFNKIAQQFLAFETKLKQKRVNDPRVLKIKVQMLEEREKIQVARYEKEIADYEEEIAGYMKEISEPEEEISESERTADSKIEGWSSAEVFDSTGQEVKPLSEPSGSYGPGQGEVSIDLPDGEEYRELPE